MAEHIENIKLLRLIQTFRRSYEAALRPVELEYDLTRNEVDILLFLANNPDCNTASDIVELRGLTKSHVCKSVASLSCRSYISETLDRQDRRRVRLTLLPASAKAVQAALEVQQAFFERLYQDFTPEEHLVLSSALNKISHNIGGRAW